MRGGLEVAACSEAELLAMPDVVAPQIVILDDSGSREERMATFANLRAHGPLAGVPVVGVLAYDADIDSFSTAITRGAAAYLVKPVAAEEIVAAATDLRLAALDRPHREAEAPAAAADLRVDVDIAGREEPSPDRSST